MSLSTALSEKIREAIWEAPRQDRSFILKPTPVTNRYGELIHCRIDGITVALPDAVNRWVV
jgi:hypothetical protein